MPMSKIDLKRRAEIGQERRLKRRHAFIDTAIQLIAEQGSLHGLSPDALIRRAGTSRGTFYNHFDGIDDLLQAVLTHITDDLNQSIFVEYQHVASGPVRLAYSISRFFERAEQDPAWGVTLARLILDARLISDRSREYFHADLEMGRAAGAFTITDNDVAGNIVAGLLAFSLLSICQEDFPPEKQHQTLVAMLQALGTTATDAETAVGTAAALRN